MTTFEFAEIVNKIQRHLFFTYYSVDHFYTHIRSLFRSAIRLSFMYTKKQIDEFSCVYDGCNVFESKRTRKNRPYFTV